MPIVFVVHLLISGTHFRKLQKNTNNRNACNPTFQKGMNAHKINFPVGREASVAGGVGGSVERRLLRGGVLPGPPPGQGRDTTTRMASGVPPGNGRRRRGRFSGWRILQVVKPNAFISSINIWTQARPLEEKS